VDTLLFDPFQYFPATFLIQFIGNSQGNFCYLLQLLQTLSSSWRAIHMGWWVDTGADQW